MTYTNDFLDWYSHYPKKRGKKFAQVCWSRLRKKRELPDKKILIKAVKNQSAEKRHLERQKKFVPEWPDPSKWLNQAYWENEVELPKKTLHPARKGGNGIQDLENAYNILVTSGQPGFDKFCEQVGLSAGDRESVINKYKGVFPPVTKLTEGIG